MIYFKTEFYWMLADMFLLNFLYKDVYKMCLTYN